MKIIGGETKTCDNFYAFFGKKKTTQKTLENQICFVTPVVTVFIFGCLSPVSHETEVRLKPI